MESLSAVLKPGPPRHFFPSRRRRRFSSRKSSQDLEVLYLPHPAMCVFDGACGGSLVPDDNPRRRLFIVRRKLTCQMSMEVPYYSAKRVKLPSVCFHCGGNSGAVLANDADIIELQNIHAVVRLICTFCKDAGKKPATHGTKFVTKK